MAWWILVLVFVAGACSGAVLMAICAANSAEKQERKWQDNENE